jgi:hypothetical protein
MMDLDDRRALEVLDARLRTMLPEEYQDSYEDMQPVPMRSAGLTYGADGKVAWNEIWGSFCDLAMAGGPPHKGALLEPGTRTAIAASPDRYAEVTDEIRRGVEMATELPAELAPAPGWIRVTCLNETMARWLLCAIVMENVAARREYHMLDLPAAPGFRIEKEIKNVITVIAKTCHYWLGHMPRTQQRAIGTLFRTLDEESPAVEPVFPDDDAREANQALGARIAERVQQETGLAASTRRYGGFVGVECASERVAIWMMRALVAGNVLSRREGKVLFAPVNPDSDPDGEMVVRGVNRAYRLAAARGVR